jgi:hypothetical protein
MEDDYGIDPDDYFPGLETEVEQHVTAAVGLLTRVIAIARGLLSAIGACLRVAAIEVRDDDSK